MCGITGYTTFAAAAPVNMDILQSMNQAIYHRGPDQDGIEIVDNVGLAMRRLSIIDLAGGKQPIYNEDHSVRVVYNGEIYNFKALRAELITKGHQFSTDSDTEVIVHAYEEYGVDCVKRFNGMFAFALHDHKKKILFIARDHVGIKPLFYTLGNNYFAWGSELKTLLKTQLLERNLDYDAVNEFLTWEYVAREKTLLSGVNKLLPGHLLLFELDRHKLTIQQYWDIPCQPNSDKNIDELTEQLDEILQKSVQQQLVSDVPLGAFLSGGVDSSLIVAAMKEANTFSIGFDDPSYNELAYSRTVAKHLNVSHETQIIAPQVADLFDDLMYFMDDPIGDFSIFPTYLVSKLARQHVTVSLSGDGGDELFGGYETYLANNKVRFLNFVPPAVYKYTLGPIFSAIKPQPQKKGTVNKLKRLVEGLQESGKLNHARWRIFLSESVRQRLFSTRAKAEFKHDARAHIENLFAQAGERDALNKDLYVDMHSYLVDNCLVKVDRMSMAVSLEARVPFLDKEVVEFAFSIPAKYKIHKGITKYILKRVAEKYIPHDCVYRAKEGFSIPIKHWLGTQFRPIMEHALDERRIEQEGLFDSATVKQLKQQHLAGTANHSHILWSLIVFQSWREKWLGG